MKRRYQQEQFLKSPPGIRAVTFSLCGGSDSDTRTTPNKRLFITVSIDDQCKYRASTYIRALIDYANGQFLFQGCNIFYLE